MRKVKSLEFLDKLIDLSIEYPDLTPDRILIIDTNKEKLHRLLTPSRLELISVLKEKSPKSVGELAKLLNRPIESVSKDLNILENYGILEFIKTGKQKQPKLEKEMLLIPLTR